MGVSEPSIQVEDKNRIRVQLAGVEDQESARKLLSTSANLTFRDVDDNLLLDGDDLKANGAKGSFDQQNRPIVSLTLKDAKNLLTSQVKLRQNPQVKIYWLYG